MQQKTTGVVGFGEAATGFITGLQTVGYSNFQIYSQHQPGSAGYERYKAKAQELMVPLYCDLVSFLQGVDVLFSLPPCSAALAVANQVVPHMKPDTMYVDLTAGLPGEKAEMAALCAGYGVKLVDAAIMGAVATFKHRVPVCVSGSGAREFYEYFCQWGMELEYVGETAGQASAIKLCRSIYTKGTQALLYELITVADRFGITDQILDGIDKTYYLQGFRAEAERLYKSTLKHSKRRVDEMCNVQLMIEELGEPGTMTKATIKVLQSIEQSSPKY